ncbi:MAG: amidohydrolase [Pseudomonadales bacterium]|nr:amidohydrolase [Pseudomonadales bacterium]
MILHLVQTELHWEDPAANTAHMEQCLTGIEDGVVVLPEMFSTGFSMASEALAEAMSGPTVAWMKSTARQRQLTLCGSVIIGDAGSYFNRFIWVTPEGNLATYDKRHLFRMAGEHDYYSPGDNNITVKDGATRIRPQVCYDLRFPVWSRNTLENGYDLLLFVANWPAARRTHWLALLRARAIENLCYVVGVNRIGVDGNQVAYSGDSVVFGPEGETLLNLGSEDTVASFEPDLDRLASYREQFPAHLDADNYEIR